MSNINYVGQAGSTITGVTVTGILDFDTAGTYYLVNCTINEVTNSSGGAITLVIDNTSITTNTGPSISVNDINITIVTDGSTYNSNNDLFLVDTDTVTTFTIDGFIPTEIETIGTGTTTIIGINNAKLVGTTITATGGTLTLGDGLNPSTNWVETSGSPRYITLTNGTTETDLLGLRGLEFVDYVTNGTFNTYTLDADTYLSISGDLTIDPSKEKIVFLRDAQNSTANNPLVVETTGILRLGIQQVVNSINVFSQGSILEFLGGVTNFFSYFALVSRGSLIWNGGTIRTTGTLRVNNNSTLTINKGTILNIGDNTPQLRLLPTSIGGGSNMNVYDLILDGLTQPSRFFSTYAWNNAIFTMKRGQFQTYNEIHPEQTLLNFDNSNNVNSSDVESAQSQDARSEDIFIQNPAKKLEVIRAGNDRSIYLHTKRQISITPKDLTGSNLSEFSYYGQDFDSGNRGVGPMNATDSSQDDTATKTYSGINQTTPIADNMLIMVYYALVGVGTGQTVEEDDRASSDSIPLNVIAYDRNITTWGTKLYGLGTLVEDLLLTPDLSITETNRTTVDAYSEIEYPEKFYDYAKSYLVANYQGESNTIVSRNGDTINLGNYDLDIDANASVPFDLTGNKITIKASTFVGNTNTTGTVSLLNSAIHDGLLDNAFYAYDGVVIDEDYTKIICESTMTITFDGIVFRGELEVVNGGIVTVLGSNGALCLDSVVTLTETGTGGNGTINLDSEVNPSLGDFTLSWNGTEVIANVNNGTELSPNLASQLADSIRSNSDPLINSRATRNGNLITFSDLRFIPSINSAFQWDDDALIIFRGGFKCNPENESALNANDGGIVIFGYRCVLQLETSVYSRDFDCYLVGKGGQAIFKRDSTGINPVIKKQMSARNDYPTLNSSIDPARVVLEGLSYKLISGSTSSQKWYFGNSRNLLGDDKFENLDLSGTGEIFQAYNTTYETPTIPAFFIGGETLANLVEINSGSFNTDGGGPSGFVGSFRGGRYFINSPKFPHANKWTGDILSGFTSGFEGAFVVRFKQTTIITDGVTPIENVKCRLSSAVRIAGSGYDLSQLVDYPQDVNTDYTTGPDGSHELLVIDTIRARGTAGQGDTDGATESYQYTEQARHYGYNSPRYIYQDRNYGVGGLLGDANDTFIMTLDTDATMTEASALALTDVDDNSKLYAKLKYEWVHNDNFANPMYVTRFGDFGSFDVDVDASAVQLFSISGNKITIKSTILTAELTTTGTINFLNGATTTAPYTDQSGTTLPALTLTISANVDLTGAEVRIYDLDQSGNDLGTELAGVESSPSATFATIVIAQSNLVYVQVFKDGYVEFGQPFTMPNQSTTLDVELQVDNAS